MNGAAVEIEGESPKPPSARRVAKRALALAAVVCRSFSDHQPENPLAHDLWMRLKQWVNGQGLLDELEDDERRLIFAPLGTLHEKRRIQATWRTEGLAILAWSLGLFDLPAHHVQVDPYAATACVGLLHDTARDFVESAALHPQEQLQACRELHYAIHCRLRQFRRERTPDDMRRWIDTAWLDVLGIRGVLDDSGDLLRQLTH